MLGFPSLWSVGAEFRDVFRPVKQSLLPRPFSHTHTPRHLFMCFNPPPRPHVCRRYQNREQVLAALAPFVDEIRWAAYFSVMCELTVSSIRVIGAPYEPDPLLDRY